MDEAMKPHFENHFYDRKFLELYLFKKNGRPLSILISLEDIQPDNNHATRQVEITSELVKYTPEESRKIIQPAVLNALNSAKY